MNSYTFSKKLTVKKNYDVIVAGGGVAGVAAAVSAAKNGYSTLLLEKSNILGGLATLGLINLFVPMCNGRGKQIIFGLCEKWCRLSGELGFDTIPKEWKNGEPKEYTEVRYIQRYSPNIFAMQMTEELLASGADLLFDCIACDPVMEGNKCVGVITESKGGTELYGCKVLIDVTGDCDVMRRGGVPTVKGGNFYTYIGKLVTLESCKRAVETGNIFNAFTSITGGGINLWGDGQPANIPTWSGTTVEEVTDYLVRNQRAMLDKLRKTDKDTREVATLPLMPQFRTTCHLKGDHSFTVTDVYRHFDDSICAINDFEHRDYLFEVPYRSLYNSAFPNVLTAGRSASSHGYGWDLIRVIPPAILTGQAAGEAACLAIRDKVGVNGINVSELQSKLEKENVMIHFPDEYVPEDRTVILHGKSVAEIEGGHL